MSDHKLHSIFHTVTTYEHTKRMNSQIPTTIQSTPTSEMKRISISPVVPAHSATQARGTIPYLFIPTSTLTSTPRAILRTVTAPERETSIPVNTSVVSDYDLHLSTTDPQTQPHRTSHITDTSTPKNSNEYMEYINSASQAIPLPPPIYTLATSQVPDSKLRRHVDTLIQENIRLQEENKKRLNTLQQTTATQMATLADTVSRLTSNIEVLTNTSRPLTSTWNMVTLEGVTLLEPHLPTPFIRYFTEQEQLQGTKNFKEWAASVHTELQLHEIVETLMSDGAMEAPWPLSPQIRADAVTRRIILQSVSPKMRPDLYACLSAYHMWKLLNRRYRVVSLYSSHQIMSKIETVLPQPNRTAVEFIQEIQRLRDEYASVAQDHSEAYWASVVLRKLQTKYKTEA